MEALTFEEGTRLIDTDRIDARRLYSDPRCDGVQINLAPGGEIERHSTEEDVFIYVLKGPLTASIGKETREAQEGMLIPCLGGVEKSLKNHGNEQASVLVVKLKK